MNNTTPDSPTYSGLIDRFRCVPKYVNRTKGAPGTSVTSHLLSSDARESLASSLAAKEFTHFIYAADLDMQGIY